MKKIILFIVSVLTVLVFTGTALAKVSDYIPVGGMLTDLSGTPRDGYFDIRFAIYDSASGGSELWSETRDGGNQVQVTDGLFMVYLGEVETLDFMDLIDANELWLGIKVGTDTEMNRIRMASVPFTHEAQFCREVVDTECSEGEFLRGWDSDTGDPICEEDKSATLADGGTVQGLTNVIAGTGLDSDSHPTSPTLSVDFGEVATQSHTHTDMATQTWVGTQGFATTTWVSSQNFATQTWVGNQSFATETWVNNQSFATETWVGNQDYATETYVTNALDSYQPDIEEVSCEYGIGSIDDLGQVTCASSSGGLPPDGLDDVSNNIMTNVLSQTNNSTDTPIVIPTSPTGVSSTITVPTTGTVRSVKVTVDITHPDIGELEVRLYSPNATMVTLHDHSDSGTVDLNFTYPDDRVPASGSMDDFIDEDPDGVWTLQVIDNTGGNDGTLSSWSVTIGYLADAEITVTGNFNVNGELQCNGTEVVGLMSEMVMPTVLMQELELLAIQENNSWTYFYQEGVVLDIFTDDLGYLETVNIGTTTAIWSSYNGGRYYRDDTDVLNDEPGQIDITDESWVDINSYVINDNVYRFQCEAKTTSSSSGILRVIWDYEDSSSEIGEDNSVFTSWYSENHYNPYPLKTVTSLTLQGYISSGPGTLSTRYRQVIGFSSTLYIDIDLPDNIKTVESAMLVVRADTSANDNITYNLYDSEGDHMDDLSINKWIKIDGTGSMDGSKMSTGVLRININPPGYGNTDGYAKRIYSYALKFWTE